MKQTWRLVMGWLLLAISVHGQNNFVGQFQGDGRNLTNLQVRFGPVTATNGNTWSNLTGTATLKLLTGSGATTSSNNLQIPGTVTAARFAGDGAALSNLSGVIGSAGGKGTNIDLMTPTLQDPELVWPAAGANAWSAYPVVEGGDESLSFGLYNADQDVVTNAVTLHGNGDVDISGRILSVNGSTGAVGQVLAANGWSSNLNVSGSSNYIAGKLGVGAFETGSHVYIAMTYTNADENIYGLRVNESLGFLDPVSARRWSGAVLGEITIPVGMSYDLPGVHRGLYGYVQHYGTGGIGEASGAYLFVINRAGGTITNVFGVNFSPQNLSTGAMLRVGGVFVNNVINTNGGYVPGVYGLWMEKQTGTTNAWVIHSMGAHPTLIGGPLLMTNGYSIGQSDYARSPYNVYANNSLYANSTVIAGSHVIGGASGVLQLYNRGGLRAFSEGVFALTDADYNGSAVEGLIFGHNTTNFPALWRTNSNLFVGTGNRATTNRFGIGTNNPQATLHVNGTVRFDNTGTASSTNTSVETLIGPINWNGSNYMLRAHHVP